MKLISAELKNFRNFYDKHTFEFSTDPDQPITVFVGQNGGGKTTLLNAIFFAFTGRFTPRFDNPNSLVNDDALKEGVKESHVEILFEHEGRVYAVRRTKTVASRESFDFYSLDSNGHRTREQPEQGQNFINTILPPNLVSWFIFDGEAIGEVELDGSPKLKDSLNTTFGFDQVNKFLDDIDSVANSYARALGKDTGDKELESLNDQIEELGENIKRYVANIKEATEQIDRCDKTIWRLSEKLGKIDASSEIEGKLRAAKNSIKQHESNLENAKRQRNETIRKNAVAVLLKDEASRLTEKFKEVSEAQDIPSPTNEILVRNILNAGECICGRPVLEGTEPYLSITGLLDSATTREMSARIQAVDAFATTMVSKAGSYEQELIGHRRNISNYVRLLEDAKDDWRAIQKQYDGLNQKEIEDLRTRRDAAIFERKGYEDRKRNDETSLARDKKDLVQKELDREKRIASTSRNKSLKKYKDIATRLRNYAHSRFERQQTDVLEVLSKELSSSMERLLTKNFNFEVMPESYKIIPRDMTGTQKSLSTGERISLIFAFIASIVGMASQKTKIGSVDWIVKPVVAPLVLDAPFSALDDLYRSKTAINISKSVDQCIFMFDAGKWRDELAKPIESRVGKFYVFVKRARGPEKIEVGRTVFQAYEGGESYYLNEYEHERDDSYHREVKLHA